MNDYIYEEAIMKRKLVSAMMMPMMAVSLLAGCGNNTDSSNSKNTSGNAATGEGSSDSIGAKIEVDENAVSNITVEGDYSDADLTVFIYAQDHEKAVYQSLIDKFKENTKANVTFEVTTGDEYGQKILAYKAADDMPDIFYVGPEAVASNVDDGYLLSLIHI